jgi:hypothetical protein
MISLEQSDLDILDSTISQLISNEFKTIIKMTDNTVIIERSTITTFRYGLIMHSNGHMTMKDVVIKGKKTN